MRIRNEIVINTGIPALLQNRFKQSPFIGSDFGWCPSLGYFYELCRLCDNSILETIKIDIAKKDRWIKVSCNAFKLEPEIFQLNELEEIDGIKFSLPPCNLSEMRIHIDDRKGIPLLDIEFWQPSHKLRRSSSFAGLNKAISSLNEKIEYDLKNIDQYFKRWYDMNTLSITSWEGIVQDG